MTTLYVKNNCVQCSMTKKMLDKLGVTYETVNLEETPEALEMILNMGFLSAPVVIASDGNSFAGFQPEKIQAIADAAV